LVRGSSTAPSPTIGPAWRPLRAACRSLKSLGQLPQIVLDLLLQRPELLEITRLRELGQRLHVDDRDLRGLARLAQLLQQAIDGLQLLLDPKGLGNVQRGPAGELVLRSQVVNLVLVPQTVHQMHEVLREPRPLVAHAVPQLLQLPQLLVADLAPKALLQVGRGVHLARQVVVVAPGERLHAVRLIGRQDLCLALQQPGHERVNARSEPPDLAGIDVDGAGQLLFGEPAHGPEREHVVERRGDHVRWLLGRRGELLRVVPLVRMNDAAQGPTLTGLPR
jgi:hypothetical protein